MKDNMENKAVFFLTKGESFAFFSCFLTLANAGASRNFFWKEPFLAVAMYYHH
jgi:hypothetical protein